MLGRILPTGHFCSPPSTGLAGFSRPIRFGAHSRRVVVTCPTDWALNVLTPDQHAQLHTAEPAKAVAATFDPDMWGCLVGLADDLRRLQDTARPGTFSDWYQAADPADRDAVDAAIADHSVSVRALVNTLKAHGVPVGRDTIQRLRESRR